MKHVDMDEIYRRLPQNDIPWNIEDPPLVLVELVETGKIRPSKAIDLGCGTGNYTILFSQEGI